MVVGRRGCSARQMGFMRRCPVPAGRKRYLFRTSFYLEQTARYVDHLTCFKRLLPHRLLRKIASHFSARCLKRLLSHRLLRKTASHFSARCSMACGAGYSPSGLRTGFAHNTIPAHKTPLAPYFIIPYRKTSMFKKR